MVQLIPDTDLLNMFITLGNDVAVINGVSVTGIFSNKFLMIDDAGLMVESTVPNFTCRSSDVSSVVDGDTFVINSTNYVVETLEPDSQGGSMIILHK